MVGDEVIVLSDLATSIVFAVPESGHKTLSSLVTEMVEEYGAPPPPYEARDVVSEHIHDLAVHNILQVEEPAATTATFTASDTEVIRSVHAALRAVINAGETWQLPANVSPGKFFAAVVRQRVGAQVATGLDRLQLPDELRSRLRAYNDSLHAANRSLIGDAHHALEALEQRGIRALVFKGMPLAVQAWGDEGARGFGDIDLLVSPEDLDVAHQCFVASGWSAAQSYPRPDQAWGWRQLVRLENEMPLSRGLSDLDLHWHVSAFRSTFPGFDRLWARREVVDVGGRPVPTLSAYDALAHSAGHAAKDHWRLARGLADVHRLASAASTWEMADRPLRPDQLASLGLAARMFGIPAGAPEIIWVATTLAEGFWKEAMESQVGPEQVPETERHPGVQLTGNLRVMRLTGASPSDYVRDVMRSALPPRLLAAEPESPGGTAAARVFARRLGEVTRRYVRV